MPNRLKELREAYGLSLEELALDLKNTGWKTTSMTLNRWERGESQPRQSAWEKLAYYYDVDVPYLMGLSDYNAPFSMEDAGSVFADYDLDVDDFISALSGLRFDVSKPNSGLDDDLMDSSTDFVKSLNRLVNSLASTKDKTVKLAAITELTKLLDNFSIN